jgi:hypothetical protein
LRDRPGSEEEPDQTSKEEFLDEEPAGDAEEEGSKDADGFGKEFHGVAPSGLTGY